MTWVSKGSQWKNIWYPPNYFYSASEFLGSARGSKNIFKHKRCDQVPSPINTNLSVGVETRSQLFHRPNFCISIYLFSFACKFFPIDWPFDSLLSWSNFNLRWLEIALYWEFKSLIETPMCGLLYWFSNAMQQSNWCNPVKKMGIETVKYILLVLAGEKSSSFQKILILLLKVSKKAASRAKMKIG